RDLLVNSSFGLTEVAAPTTPAKPPSAQTPAPAAPSAPDAKRGLAWVLGPLSVLISPPAAAKAPPPVETKPAPPPRLTGFGVLWAPVLVLVIGISYTPSNLVLLCSFGAMLGSYAIRTLAEDTEARRGHAPLKGSVHVPALTAMLHGLCVYLGLVGGLIV